MITISWHLILFIIVLLFLIGGLCGIEQDDYGSQLDFRPILWFAGIVIVVVVYGGVVWW
jgi:hypothetical protein